MYEVSTRPRHVSRFIALAAASFGSQFVATASAHEWYPYACCSNRDCRPVNPDAVQFTAAGWRVKTTGETIPFGDAKFSPDGRYHICSSGGRPEGRTICLFTPGAGS